MPDRRSRDLTADLLADMESEAVSELAEQMVTESRPAKRTTVKRASAKITPPAPRARPSVAKPAALRPVTALEPPALEPPALEPPALAPTPGAGPYLETTFFLLPSGWSWPGIRRDGADLIVTAGPIRVRSSRR